MPVPLDVTAAGRFQSAQVRAAGYCNDSAAIQLRGTRTKPLEGVARQQLHQPAADYLEQLRVHFQTDRKGDPATALRLGRETPVNLQAAERPGHRADVQMLRSLEHSARLEDETPYTEIDFLRDVQDTSLASQDTGRSPGWQELRIMFDIDRQIEHLPGRPGNMAGYRAVLHGPSAATGPACRRDRSITAQQLMYISKQALRVHLNPCIDRPHTVQRPLNP